MNGVRRGSGRREIAIVAVVVSDWMGSMMAARMGRRRSAGLSLSLLVLQIRRGRIKKSAKKLKNILK